MSSLRTHPLLTRKWKMCSLKTWKLNVTKGTLLSSHVSLASRFVFYQPGCCCYYYYIPHYPPLSSRLFPIIPRSLSPFSPLSPTLFPLFPTIPPFSTPLLSPSFSLSSPLQLHNYTCTCNIQEPRLCLILQFFGTVYHMESRVHLVWGAYSGEPRQIHL